MDVAEHVASGEVLAVVGPNGAGKSTLLRGLAGLVPLSDGTVRLAGRTLEDAAAGIRVPPDVRRVGVLLQDPLLFPHLTAVDNVAFGIRMQGVRRREARAQARTWLDRVGLRQHAASRPADLSGGQAQRVGLARALAVAPRMLLLDEPLAALDVDARLHVRRLLHTHLDAFDGPVILVTHEPVEAVALADRLAVMEAGRLVQTGPVSEVARRPRSAWAARLVGLNLFHGRARDGVVALDEGGRELTAAEPVTGEVFAVVHPRAVAVHRDRPSGSPRNVWRGRVVGMDLHGDHVRVQVGDGGWPGIVAEITPAAVGELDLARNDGVWVSVKASEVDLYPA